MKAYKRLVVALIFVTLPLGAQSTHSSLKDPQLLKRFQKISHLLMCQCGCNMPLYYCNHIGHCNAWPMRAAIDQLLAHGYTDEQIIDGFVHGFGSLVDTHPAFALARSAEYRYLVPRFRDGLGEVGLTQPKGNALALYLLLGILLILGFALFFLRKHLKKSLSSSSAITLSTAEEEALLSRLYQEDT